MMGEVDMFGSTADTRKTAAARSDRVPRFQPNVYGGGGDELNDREAGFDLDRAIRGSPIGGHLPQQAGRPARHANSLRPDVPRSSLINSAKMQLGGPQKPLQPSSTLHISSAQFENPLFGYSEDERRRKVYKDEFMKF